MAEKVGVTYYINISVYGADLADIFAGIIAYNIASKARNIVRVGSTGNLKNSITTERKSKGNYETYAQAAYAAAQEWGLAPFGKPNYSYTPYMIPALMQSITAGEKREALRQAQASVKRRGL